VIATSLYSKGNALIASNSGALGFPLAAASAVTILFTPSRRRCRVVVEAARRLSFRSAELGMMFSASPAWMADTVTTAKSRGSVSRETRVWSRVMVWAACRMGSREVCGVEAWDWRPGMWRLRC
jgi:hypothetical protein